MTFPDLVEAAQLPSTIEAWLGVIAAAITVVLMLPAFYELSRCAHRYWKLQRRRADRALRDDERRYPPDLGDDSSRSPPSGH